MPTEVQALSSGVTSYWQVTTGNSIGTMCEFVDDSRFDIPTTATSVSYIGQGLTSTIPTQVRAKRGRGVCGRRRSERKRRGVGGGEVGAQGRPRILE